MGLRVGLVAPVGRDGRSSGVGRYIVSLTEALAALRSDPEHSLPELEFVLVRSPRNGRWMAPTVRERMTVVSENRPTDSTFADLDLDVVHLLHTKHVPTERPTVFNPHYLGYLFHPELYEQRILREWKENVPAGCREATVVDTPSQATKETVVEEYDVDPDRVYPMPLGPSITPDPDGEPPLEAVRTNYDLPDSFVLYPATTWPHKNHRRLLEALSYVRETYDETVPLVCTGNRTTPWAAPGHEVENLAETAGVRDLGYVETEHLRALYHLSDLLVYPSLYETGGLPLLEGWAFDTPVVCSDIPPLRERGGDAVAYVDPESVADIGDTIHRVWTDERRRERLRERARDRRERFTWRRTARIYHALYRRAAGRELSSDDRRALAYPDEGGSGD